MTCSDPIYIPPSPWECPWWLWVWPWSPWPWPWPPWLWPCDDPPWLWPWLEREWEWPWPARKYSQMLLKSLPCWSHFRKHKNIFLFFIILHSYSYFRCNSLLQFITYNYQYQVDVKEWYEISMHIQLTLKWFSIIIQMFSFMKMILKMWSAKMPAISFRPPF